MRCAWLWLIFIVFTFSDAAAVEKRVALVIGNSSYQHAPYLANPRNDAGDIAARLKGLDFEVVTGQDLDLMGMRDSVRTFVGKLEGADIGLFFYAGHGLQVNGINYMVPVEAQLASQNDLDFEALPVSLVLTAMERNVKVSLLFLDACRDNPLIEALARTMGSRSASLGRGLAKLETGVGSLIAFATQPGNVALDGKGRNSPFTTGLLKHLGQPGQSLTDELIQVRREVLEATNGKQVPWDSSSLTGPVVLNPRAQQAVLPKADQANSQGIELAYWESIKDATEASYYEAYLAQFPEGAFAALAKLKVDAIRQKEVVVSPPPTPQATSPATDVASLERSDAAFTNLAAGQIEERVLNRSVQTELIRLGCLVGQADGKWGAGSRKALRSYAERQGVETAMLVPTPDLLRGLKANKDRVCPLVCEGDKVARNGRCEVVANSALRGYDGAWLVTRRATNSHCGWRELTENVSINNGKISGGQMQGTVQKNGSVNITLRFVYNGKQESNVLSGRIENNTGSGTFYHVRGECAGKIILRKL